MTPSNYFLRRNLALATLLVTLATLAPVQAQRGKKADAARTAHRDNPDSHGAGSRTGVSGSGVSGTTVFRTALPDSPAVALTGGKLLTITHGVIENGVLVMEHGRITAAGAAGSVTIPANARVIDVSGMTVYPGMIDAESNLGLTEISAVDMTNDLAETSDEIMPQMHVWEAFHAESELIPVTRYNGITNAIVAPQPSDTLPGQSSFIQLDGASSDEMVLVRDIALPLNFTGNERRNSSFDKLKYPSTRMGMAAQLRQAFIDAQDYSKKRGDWRKKHPGTASEQASPGDEGETESPGMAQAGPAPGEISERNNTEAGSSSPAGTASRPRTGARTAARATAKSDDSGPPKRDLKLEALLPYLEGRKPVVLAAQEPSDVQVALHLAREFNLKVILNHVAHSQQVLDYIAAARIPVIVGPIYATPKAGERYDAIFSLPAQLYKRGVKIAFASYDSHNARNLPYAAGYAVAFGLPYEEAMRAVTLNPAEIFGVAGELGSLDAGKQANVVVANGDPLDLKTEVKQVYIGGRASSMENKQTRLRDQYSR